MGGAGLFTSRRVVSDESRQSSAAPKARLLFLAFLDDEIDDNQRDAKTDQDIGIGCHNSEFYSPSRKLPRIIPAQDSGRTIVKILPVNAFPVPANSLVD
jgi:hypothetical protein